MVHIVAFSLAFPPANNVDEYLHFDLAIRYSHGQIPSQAYPVSDEALSYVARYGTWEYTCVPAAFPGRKYPPPFWTLPTDQAAQMIAGNSVAWQRPNYEDSQPPLYYLVAGFWWRMGHWLGLKMGNLYYWLRLLDVLIVVAVIVMAYVTARIIFPENVFLRLGAPALIALMP